VKNAPAANVMTQPRFRNAAPVFYS